MDPPSNACDSLAISDTPRSHFQRSASEARVQHFSELSERSDVANCEEQSEEDPNSGFPSNACALLAITGTWRSHAKTCDHNFGTKLFD